MVDGLAIEAPVAADLESRNAFLFEQAVDGRGMDAEIIRELSHHHYRTSHRRPASSRAPPLSSTLRHNIISRLSTYRALDSMEWKVGLCALAVSKIDS